MKASLFVAICPYSSLLFVTATANEKMDNWISCHVKALDYLGKRPGIIVPDNAPTATYRPVKNKPGLAHPRTLRRLRRLLRHPPRASPAWKTSG